MPKFRRKNYVVDAMQSTDGDWVITDGEGEGDVYTNENFFSLFEEVSPMQKVSPLAIEFKKGEEVLKGGKS